MAAAVAVAAVAAPMAVAPTALAEVVAATDFHIPTITDFGITDRSKKYDTSS